MDAIQEQIHQECLKPAGFRKRGRTHNRSVEDGIIQVVNFQLGTKPNREDYDFLWVNLGVRRPDDEPEVGSVVQDYHCGIRFNLLEFIYTGDYRGYTSAYFTLPSSRQPGPLTRLVRHLGRKPAGPTFGGTDTANQIIELLNEYALPMFEDLSSRDKITANLHKYPTALNHWGGLDGA